MSEAEQSILESLSVAQSHEDLVDMLPPQIVDSLGGDEIGKRKIISVLVSLAVFAPPPQAFSRHAFDAIVGFDGETNEPLDSKSIDSLFQAAIKLGFIKSAENERYIVDPRVNSIVKKLYL